MLRTQFIKRWSTPFNSAMEAALFDPPLSRKFAQLKEFGRLPDESTIVLFKHRLEKHELSEQILQTVNEILTVRGLLLMVGTAIDATLIAAPTSTKNKGKARHHEMHTSKKGNHWYFGMKHTGVAADSDLEHGVRCTSEHVSVNAEGSGLLHRHAKLGLEDAGYQGIEKRPDAEADALWHIAMRPGSRKKLDENNQANVMLDQAEKLKGSVWDKDEHPFRVIKSKDGFVKVRYRELKKNTVQLFKLFALSYLRMVRCKLIGTGA